MLKVVTIGLRFTVRDTYRDARRYYVRCMIRRAIISVVSFASGLGLFYLCSIGG